MGRFWARTSPLRVVKTQKNPRLEEVELEEENLRSKLQEQVEEFGFTPGKSDPLGSLLV